jgi:gluconokinase
MRVTAHVLVMGVSGAGKSSLAQALAERLGAGLVDADDLHPASNRAKMAAGIPLTDADRTPWLAALADVLRTATHDGRSTVLACSALKRSYRDVLRTGAPALRIVHLRAQPATLHHRLAARTGHFLPASLLDSQLATLEPPTPDEHALTLTAEQPLDALVAQAVAWLTTAA